MPTYQWKISSDKITWNDISDATNSNTYTINYNTCIAGTNYYKCTISNTYADSIDSNVATVNVKEISNHIVTYNFDTSIGGDGKKSQPYYYDVSDSEAYYVIPKDPTTDGSNSIQLAIDKAAEIAEKVNEPVEVWIKAGTYKPGSAMTMKNNVAIYGGFEGTETSKDQRVAGNNTILDGEGKYRVFYNNYTETNPLTNSAKLDNATIQNGYVDSNSGSNGAGMYNVYASPEITNCTFSSNSANSVGGLINTTFGGGMYNGSSSPTLTNCTFSNNRATTFGGGMYNGSSSPTLTNCTFSDNSANSGGGMGNTSSPSSSPTLINCTFTNNSASIYGGGMHNYGNSSPTLINCILWGNTASNSGNEIYNNGSTTTIDTCVIQGGYSDGGTYTNIITTDPKLMDLDNYGGFVRTCAVESGSSAIGKGKVITGVTTDARGYIRSTTAPTIGAYEYNGTLPS